MPRSVKTTALDSLLEHESYRFEFFQAVDVLMQIAPELEPVGYDYPPDREIVRFRANASLDFPPSAMQEIELPQDGPTPASMIVNFMGLTGPQGALPQHYTELIVARLRKKDGTLRDFLDLFNHRLISLFFRAWEKYRVPSCYGQAGRAKSRAAREGESRYRAFVVDRLERVDPLSQIPLDLAGLGEPALRYATRRVELLERRTTISDNTLRYFSGLLSQQHRSAVGLERLLEDTFGCHVQVKQFCGQWLLLDRQDQTSLGKDENSRLGITAIAGQRVWDVQGRFRVCLGPLNYRQFCQFLPVGSSYRKLGQLVRLYAGQQFDFEFGLGLLSKEVPACQLGATGPRAPRLGWNTWIVGDSIKEPTVTLDWTDLSGTDRVATNSETSNDT